MPPHHELEKIAVELLLALVAAGSGLLAGRSRHGKRFVRGAVYVMLTALLLVAVGWVVTILFFSDYAFERSSFGLYVVVGAMLLMPVIAAIAAVALIAAGMARTWRAGQARWLIALVIASAAPLALALILFAVDLSHVEPNPKPVLWAALLGLLSLPAMVAYAFEGTRREPATETVVHAARKGKQG